MHMRERNYIVWMENTSKLTMMEIKSHQFLANFQGFLVKSVSKWIRMAIPVLLSELFNRFNDILCIGIESYIEKSFHSYTRSYIQMFYIINLIVLACIGSVYCFKGVFPIQL